jgi:PiT family inorganic phosphate transporter
LEGLNIEPIVILLLMGGAFVGWNIGANDTANCIGPTVGCGLLSYKRAVTMVVIFSFFGGILQGQNVMKTVGTGIISTELDPVAILTALICSGMVVMAATLKKLPTSTSQAIVGGVVGVGLVLHADINIAKLYVIAGSWVLCPILVLGLAFTLSQLLGRLLRIINISKMLIQNTMGHLAIAASCYVAFSLGANHAGTAMGPIANLGIVPPFFLLAIGGMSIALGAAFYGQKVTDTVGKGITPLDLPGAFVALISSAFSVHLFSILGIPVSTSSAIVGAVVGVGLVKGARTISKNAIITIFVGWVLTPTLAAVSSFLIYTGYRMIVH